LSLTAATDRPTARRPPLPALALADPSRAVLWLIAIGTLIRLVLAWALGYGNGEAYYVATARFLALSYYDQPPLFLWVTHAMIRLGGTEALWLRLPFVLMFAASTWLMYRLTALLYGERAGLYAALLLNLSVLFFVSIGSWVQPDGPLFLFLLAGTYCAARVLLAARGELSKAAIWRWWLLAGLSFGLALLSKYHAVLILAGLFLFLLTRADRRHWLVHPAPWAAAVVALLVFSPVLIWNAQNDWVSFVFQGSRGSGSELRLDWLLRNIAGQAVWLLPWIWLPLVAVFVGALRRGPSNLPGWLLASLAIIPIMLFTAVSAWAPIGFHFHWQAPGYLMLFPLLGQATAGRIEAGNRVTRWWLTGSAVAMVLTIALLGSHVANGWGRNLPFLATAADPTLDGLDWRELEPVLAERGWLDRPGLFAVGTNWHQTGKIDVELGDRLPVLCLCRDPRNLAFGWNQADFAGRDALIIGQDRYLAGFNKRWRPFFQAVEPQPDIIVRRGGRPEITLRVFHARRFRPPFPMPLPPR